MTTHVHFDLDAARASLEQSIEATFALAATQARPDRQEFVRAQKVLTIASVEFAIARLQLVNESVPPPALLNALANVIGGMMHNMLWMDDNPDASTELIKQAATIAVYGASTPGAGTCGAVHHRPVQGGRA